jgi:hypothetical protein
MSSESEWVGCDRCKKWRKLPPTISEKSLSDKWYCEMNTWNPQYASCVAPQEQEVLSEIPSFVPVKAALPNQQAAPPKVKIVFSSDMLKPEEKRIKLEEDNDHHLVLEKEEEEEEKIAPPNNVTAALVALCKVLQQTADLVAEFSGPEAETSLFKKINEIVTRLDHVSKSASKPVEGDEAALRCEIPRELLEFLDRTDGQNNPSLYTESVLKGVLAEHQRMQNANKSFDELLKDFHKQDNTG